MGMNIFLNFSMILMNRKYITVLFLQISRGSAALIGLATLTVASGGLAIGAAVVGFSDAPAAWGLSCFTH